MRRKQSTLRRSSATESSEEDDPICINQDIPPAHGYGEHRNIRGDVDDAAVFQGSEWTQTANSTAETRIGVCMSGNELYDSMFSLGVLNSLLARSVRIDFLSTVDAGSFVASSYLRWKDRERHQHDTLLWQEYYFRRQCVAYQKIATENGDPRPRPFASGFFGNLVLLGFVFMVMLLPIVELTASVFTRCLYVATSWVYPQCRENNVHGGIFLTLLSTVGPLAGHMLLVLAKKVRVSAFGESLVRNAAAKLFVLTAVFLQTFSLFFLMHTARDTGPESLASVFQGDSLLHVSPQQALYAGVFVHAIICCHTHRWPVFGGIVLHSILLEYRLGLEFLQTNIYLFVMSALLIGQPLVVAWLQDHDIQKYRYWLNLLYKPFFDAKDRWQRAGKQVIAGSRGDNLGRSHGASTVDESEEETISDNDRIAMGRLAGIAPDWLFSMADQGPVYSSHQEEGSGEEGEHCHSIPYLSSLRLATILSSTAHGQPLGPLQAVFRQLQEIAQSQADVASLDWEHIYTTASFSKYATTVILVIVSQLLLPVLVWGQYWLLTWLARTVVMTLAVGWLLEQSTGSMAYIWDAVVAMARSVANKSPLLLLVNDVVNFTSPPLADDAQPQESRTDEEGNYLNLHSGCDDKLGLLPLLRKKTDRIILVDTSLRYSNRRSAAIGPVILHARNVLGCVFHTLAGMEMDAEFFREMDIIGCEDETEVFHFLVLYPDQCEPKRGEILLLQSKSVSWHERSMEIENGKNSFSWFQALDLLPRVVSAPLMTLTDAIGEKYSRFRSFFNKPGHLDLKALYYEGQLAMDGDIAREFTMFLPKSVPFPWVPQPRRSSLKQRRNSESGGFEFASQKRRVSFSPAEIQSNAIFAQDQENLLHSPNVFSESVGQDKAEDVSPRSSRSSRSSSSSSWPSRTSWADLSREVDRNLDRVPGPAANIPFDSSFYKFRTAKLADPYGSFSSSVDGSIFDMSDPSDEEPRPGQGSEEQSEGSLDDSGFASHDPFNAEGEADNSRTSRQDPPTLESRRPIPEITIQPSTPLTSSTKQCSSTTRQRRQSWIRASKSQSHSQSSIPEEDESEAATATSAISTGLMEMPPPSENCTNMFSHLSEKKSFSPKATDNPWCAEHHSQDTSDMSEAEDFAVDYDRSTIPGNAASNANKDTSGVFFPKSADLPVYPESDSAARYERQRSFKAFDAPQMTDLPTGKVLTPVSSPLVVILTPPDSPGENEQHTHSDVKVNLPPFRTRTRIVFDKRARKES
ncbi:uncharacterized protein LOC135819571 isoform X2 [Sycon ciliatum]|uniref:uncharacterized protein LOC135819571 isoform X2 n=1 Tax=Sycon ciliatum TaxID=27933 RepID=UPI0031F6D0CA